MADPSGESRITRGMGASVPAAVRKALGVGPGDVLEWKVSGGTAVVRGRRAKRPQFLDFDGFDIGKRTNATAEHDDLY